LNDLIGLGYYQTEVFVAIEIGIGFYCVFFYDIGFMRNCTSNWLFHFCSGFNRKVAWYKQAQTQKQETIVSSVVEAA